MTFLNVCLRKIFFKLIIKFNFILGVKGTTTTSTSPKSAKERNTTRNLPKRSASSVGKSATSGMGMRSVSVGMLNQAVGDLTYILWLFKFTVLSFSFYPERL